MIWFLQYDPRMPDTVREKMQRIGLHDEEFVDTSRATAANGVRTSSAAKAAPAATGPRSPAPSSGTRTSSPIGH